MTITSTPTRPEPGSRLSRAGTLPVVHVLFACVVAASMAFIAGVVFANALDSSHNNDEFEVFWQSWDILDDEFYYDLPSDREMVYGAIQGLTFATNDPYTFFVPPMEAEFDAQQRAGEFGGIGAYVSQNRSGQLVISDTFPGLPAEEAGLLPNDVILEVDGVSIEGWPLDEAVTLLRGDIGTAVTLTVYRASEDKLFSVQIVRARVELPTIDSRMYEDIAYIRLFSFNSTATAVMQHAIEELLEQTPRALILDLRGNPGGLLSQAVAVSDLFLDEGVVVKQRARDGSETVFQSSSGQLAEDIPLVVLIDGGSASASEVVAGALYDRERAVLIGQTTYGKGSVQHVHELPDGAQIHVTTALWFTPDDTPIQDRGLVPDVEVTTPDGVEPGEDPFIDAALSYIEEG